MAVPIKAIEGVELNLPEGNCIARARVLDPQERMNLSWDRFVRLRFAAKVLEENVAASARLLDAGGYDGALALFLPEHEIDVIDPATTGGSVLDIPAGDAAYDAVIAVDVLEHIEPMDRSKALSEFARVARKHVILNYPCRGSKEAQELALKLTNNELIREHVEWELPDSDWVLDELAMHGYRGAVTPHTSIAVWLGQYVTLNLLPQQAKELNRHLVANHADEPTTNALYHLVVCERRT
ncbi:MAG: class I SAM-dependent methyltransferase [Candidatus Obscuribacterales bacterium]|nr:class I SAM-dependent methyltransferase [Candidatus Obscuribacterales bacterium]